MHRNSLSFPLPLSLCLSVVALPLRAAHSTHPIVTAVDVVTAGPVVVIVLVVLMVADEKAMSDEAERERA